jgi:hypothetical protein
MNGNYEIVISEREKDGLYDVRFLPDKDGRVWHQDESGLDDEGVLQVLDLDLRETPVVYVLGVHETYEEAKSNGTEMSLGDAWTYFFEQRN